MEYSRFGILRSGNREATAMDGIVAGAFRGPEAAPMRPCARAGSPGADEMVRGVSAGGLVIDADRERL
jgi:hypothetical protein